MTTSLLIFLGISVVLAISGLVGILSPFPKKAELPGITEDEDPQKLQFDFCVQPMVRFQIRLRDMDETQWIKLRKLLFNPDLKPFRGSRGGIREFVTYIPLGQAEGLRQKLLRLGLRERRPELYDRQGFATFRPM